MNLIASIYVYNFHLIVSYLNEGVKIFPFRDNRQKFYNSKKEYNPEIGSVALKELQANRHILYGSDKSKLVSYNLIDSQPFLNRGISESINPLENISQLSINRQLHSLFAFSDMKGIFQIDLANTMHSVENFFIPKSFDKIGDPTVSNIESQHESLLIAVRNYGVINISVDKKVIKEKGVLRSEDPQDVKQFSVNRLIVVADSEDGVLLYDLESNKLIDKFLLPDRDFPQQIESIPGAIIIKGADALYAYYFSSKKLIMLKEGKVGTMAAYYDYVFYSSKGKIFVLTSTDSFKKHDFNIDSRRIDIERITIIK